MEEGVNQKNGKPDEVLEAFQGWDPRSIFCTYVSSGLGAKLTNVELEPSSIMRTRYLNGDSTPTILSTVGLIHPDDSASSATVLMQ